MLCVICFIYCSPALDLSDMGLPQSDYIAIKVPSAQESKPKITFKEKTVSSLSVKNHLPDDEYFNSSADNFQFKRRKIIKNNVRVRSNDN